MLTYRSCAAPILLAFQVNLPRYPSLDVMRRKFKQALEECVHITS